MAQSLLQTVEHSVLPAKYKYVLDVIRVFSAVVVCTAIVLAAKVANACDQKASKSREPSSVQSISVSKSSSCDFACSNNTDTSADLYACERAQLKCETNSHLPLNTHTIGRN